MKNEFKYGSKILDNAYDKYFKRLKVTYEEYVIMLATNDEIWFCYKNTVYQVIHQSSTITTMWITEYNGKQKISEHGENFASIIELLDKFRIEGKAIKDIWQEVTFD